MSYWVIMANVEEKLLDYEDEDCTVDEAAEKKDIKDTVGSGFLDFLLKPELLRAIVYCGFENPSEGWFELTST